MKLSNVFCVIGAIVAAVATIAGAAYLVYRLVERKRLEDEYFDYDECFGDDDDDCECECCCDECEDAE